MENFEYIFDLFKNNWALVSAGSLEDHNGCTVSWGSLGTMWTRPGKSGNIATIYIHPARHTNSYLQNNDYFVISFFDNKEALSYMGSHSGRDENKDIGAGLTPIEVDGVVTYKEAIKTIICKKLYGHELDKDSLNQEIKDYYLSKPQAFPKDEKGEWHPHYLYIGDIIKTI